MVKIDVKEIVPFLTVKDTVVGDVLLIKDVEYIEKNRYGKEQYLALINFNNSKYRVNLNYSSLNNLVKEWGDESNAWLGHKVTVDHLRIKRPDGAINVIILKPVKTAKN